MSTDTDKKAKRKEFQRKDTSQGATPSHGYRNLQDQKRQPDQRRTQQHSSGRENTGAKENTHNKSSRRDNYNRTNYASKNTQTRQNNRVKLNETAEDIAEDIIRIEKEIELEMKEIKSLRLGL